jgi:HD-GYP domain-containing protein (c-di-GMP phosphodiesterase class II)
VPLVLCAGNFPAETPALATIHDPSVLAPNVNCVEPFSTSPDVDTTLRYDLEQFVRGLERVFGLSYSVVDCVSGQTIRAAEGPPQVDCYSRLSELEQIAQRGRPEIFFECAPVFLMGVPLVTAPTDPTMVAVAAFISEPIEHEQEINAAARELALEPRQLYQWAQVQVPWHPRAAEETARAIAEKTQLAQTTTQLKHQLADLSSHLLSTFEEITLLHRLTEHLSIAKSVSDICSLSAAWLTEVIPANCVAIWLNTNAQDAAEHTLDRGTERQPVLIAHGTCPLRESEFARFMERLGPRVATEPLVLNRAATSFPNWFYPEVRELISVPIREGNNLFGWLIAINHTGAGELTNSEVEFGTVEACLMSSVATILGIHAGNITLYREQSEFFASVVRALTSAIDAKDQYTCGHSDRVARLSVRLAREMGCTTEQLNTIYLSGLLHDIGKIGIDDNVLRKPGPLTPAELEHIKTHPDLGCRILDGVKQLDQVLPVVRHHHEAWNGAGYPDGLKGEESPYLARIVAVADSIDAMSSDRPYRKGIPDEKLDAILREGAASQWDPTVIAAAFRCREDLRRIGKDERKPLSLNVAGWQHELAAGNS